MLKRAATDRQLSPASMAFFQGRLDPQQLAFVEETWIKINMAL